MHPIGYTERPKAAASKCLLAKNAYQSAIFALQDALDQMTLDVQGLSELMTEYSESSKQLQPWLSELNTSWTSVVSRSNKGYATLGSAYISRELYDYLDALVRDNRLTITGLSPQIGVDGTLTYGVPERSPITQTRLTYDEKELTALKAGIEQLNTSYSDKLKALQASAQTTLQLYQANLGLLSTLQDIVYQRRQGILSAIARYAG